MFAMTYNPINENGDFITKDCLFEVKGVLYEYSGVIHDEQKVYGREITFGPHSWVDKEEKEFSFNEVGVIYIIHVPKKDI